MTTASPTHLRRSGAGVLVRAAGAGLVVTALATLAGAIAAGSGGALGALIGGTIVVAVLLTGASTVDVVAGLLPAASLLVALLTYTLQVTLVALVLWPLSRSSWAADHLVLGWLAGGVVAVALTWTVAQVVAFTRTRIPVYDLTGPAVDSDAGRRSEASPR